MTSSAEGAKGGNESEIRDVSESLECLGFTRTEKAPNSVLQITLKKKKIWEKDEHKFRVSQMISAFLEQE